MTINRLSKFAAVTLFLISGSCTAGYFAKERAALRTDGHFAYEGSLWVENSLWLLALLLILFWSWIAIRILKD